MGKQNAEGATLIALGVHRWWKRKKSLPPGTGALPCV